MMMLTFVKELRPSPPILARELLVLAHEPRSGKFQQAVPAAFEVYQPTRSHESARVPDYAGKKSCGEMAVQVGGWRELFKFCVP